MESYTIEFRFQTVGAFEGHMPGSHELLVNGAYETKQQYIPGEFVFVIESYSYYSECGCILIRAILKTAYSLETESWQFFCRRSFRPD